MVAPRKEGKNVLVLVCLPQRYVSVTGLQGDVRAHADLRCSLMRPLCGGLTMDMKQGPITGTLGQMGLGNAEVYKLE